MAYPAAVDAVIFFIAFQWAAALIRLYVRAFLVKRTGWDDAAMVMTLLLATAFSGLTITIALLTGLQDVAHVRPEVLVPSIKITLAVLVLYIAASVFLKVALALLLLRVLVRRWQVVVIYVTIGVSCVYGTFYFFYVLFQCGSPAVFPQKIIVGQCLSAGAVDGVSYTHAVLNALADLIFLVMPIALLWKENMSPRSKFSICAILGVGSVGGICTIIRIAYIHTLTKATNTFFITSKTIAVMSAAELSVGIACICFSTYKPLIRQLFPGKVSDEQTYFTTGAINSARRHESQRQSQRESYHTPLATIARPVSPSEYGDVDPEKQQQPFVNVRNVE